MGKREEEERETELISTLSDFTSKENWDKFFTIRGTDDPFEWYSEWSHLRLSLLPHLPDSPSLPRILVPGCGSSALSQELYDHGYTLITNIDFSKVVVMDMMRRHVRTRPVMRWRVMDMTSLQFEDETFDIVLDKGGLDALMEPTLGTKLGNQYLTEAKRVLNYGGKFICLTLAESHVLGLLLPKFRYGWKVSIHVVPTKPSDTPALYTFMVIAEKEQSPILHQIPSKLDIPSYKRGDQVRDLMKALEHENKVREEYSTGSDIIYSLEDLKLGAKGDLREFQPGRRAHLTLGEQGTSIFCYRAVILDAKKQPDPFTYRCGVFLVPKTRAYEWLFSSEEGQWMVVESSKAARLIMVLLDNSHSNASMDDIQKDLSPLVEQLAPENDESGTLIPFRHLSHLNRGQTIAHDGWHASTRRGFFKIWFMAAGDGLKHQEIIHKVTSPLTGSIIVDDVVYESSTDSNLPLASDELIFRRLTFERMECLVQSEGLLLNEGSVRKLMEPEQSNSHKVSSSKKKRGKKKSDSSLSANEGQLKVYHPYLASSYHTGIVAGFMLISSCLSSASSQGRMLKTVVVGLGAGLLPMFLHACFPFLCIEVVELDPVVLDLAQNFFGFVEDNRLKALIGDGIQFVRDITVSTKSEGSIVCQGKERNTNKTDILIVDVDSSDTSSGLTCPDSAFVEESFLSIVEASLSEQGLFVINLVTRSLSVREMVVSRMKKVFTNLFHLQLNEDVNEVLFALNTNAHVDSDCFEKASKRLEKLLKLENQASKQTIMDATQKIKHLK